MTPLSFEANRESATQGVAESGGLDVSPFNPVIMR
jgi:hypothetical protein